MNGKDKNTIIERLKTIDRSQKMYHSSVPEEYRDDIDIINVERKIGMRKSDKIGFDVIHQVYFVHELVLYNINSRQEEIWKKSLKTFDNFDEYYNYLNGDIYENACYYQCDLSSIKKKVDKSRMKERTSFVEKNIDEFLISPSDEDKLQYSEGEKRKKQCYAWIKKYKNVSSCSELMLIENNYIKSKLYSELTEDSWLSFKTYGQFMLWNIIYDAKNDRNKFLILMEYLSNYTCAGTLVREICSIFNPKEVVKYYNFTGSSKNGIYNQKKRLRDIADAFEKGHIDSEVCAFFDEKTHYYCEKTTYTILDEKVCRSEDMRKFSTYRFFDSFDKFVEYRNGDLSNTDLTKDFTLNYDFSKCIINEKTKLPIGSIDNLRYVIKKRYIDGKFNVLQVWYNENNVPVKHYIHNFDYFFDFVAFLKGDLSSANLILCNGLNNLSDVSSIDFTDAKITSSICDKFGIKYLGYSMDFQKVESFIVTEEHEKNTDLVLLTSRELNISENHDISGLSKYDNAKECVYYISDLHLMHKLQHFAPKSKSDVFYVIQSIVNNIVRETGNILLIGGDISSDYTVFELFIRLLHDELNRRKSNSKVVIVLGNHELWEFQNMNFNKIVEKYEKLITECGMFLLQNNILYKNSEQKINNISESELTTLSGNEIRERLRDARIIFFGGLAFSGYNEEFNANDGIYKKTISRNEEIKQSKRFNGLYNKIVQTLPDKKIVIFTHTPIDCWYEKAEYHKDYVYVSGHTHKNMFYDDGEVRVYADNQIGYSNKYPHLKCFDMDNEYDYFSDYKDGIYKISADEYKQFHRGKNIMMDFNREINVLYMLKKNQYYCFIHKSKSGSLTMLNGGALKKLNERDITYYFNNMDDVITMIKKPLDKYVSFQEKIASEIHKLGGDGTIHGCIIDIDWFNHVYVNPVDMSIKCYWASDIINKKVYPTLPSLLEKECPSMYARYTKLLKDNSNNLPMLAKGADIKVSVLPQTYLDTDIYRVSREIKKMQKLSSNILTTWYEIDNGLKKLESKKK